MAIPILILFKRWNSTVLNVIFNLPNGWNDLYYYITKDMHCIEPTLANLCIKNWNNAPKEENEYNIIIHLLHLEKQKAEIHYVR